VLGDVAGLLVQFALRCDQQVLAVVASGGDLQRRTDRVPVDALEQHFAGIVDGNDEHGRVPDLNDAVQPGRPIRPDHPVLHDLDPGVSVRDPTRGHLPHADEHRAVLRCRAVIERAQSA
jgi:hypothetical protein